MHNMKKANGPQKWWPRWKFTK